MKPVTLFKAISMALVLLFAASNPLFAAPASSPTQEKMPWTLREHYTFSGGALRIDYAKDNAEWRIKLFQEDSESSRMNPDVILRDVGFSLELADGRVITNEMLGKAGETIMAREPYTSDLLGQGTTYTVKFALLDGLAVEHTLITMRQWNFIRLVIKVTNQSGAPLGIVKIWPAIISSGHFCGLSPNAISSTRGLRFRGLYPVYATDSPPSSLRIYDPSRQVSLLLGFLPGELSSSGFLADMGGSPIEGKFECDFSPVKMLQPGESLETDPISIGFGIAPATMDAQYNYLLQNACRVTACDTVPRAWVTIPDTHGLAVLRAEAANAIPAGIQHALIPGNWEGKPGSLDGGAPDYPKNIAEAARSLRDAGLSPGITIDPLRIEGGGGAWSAKSQDGQQWVNPKVQEGRDFTVSRMKKLLDKGFVFLVIEESQIPDDVLKQFGLTRAQADAYAFAAAKDAAVGGKVPVLAASHSRVNVVRDDILEAAAALAQLRERNIGTSAITVRMDDKNSLDEETALAFRLLNAPVEFIGTPPRAAHQALSEVFSQQAIKAHAQDVSRKGPQIWMLVSALSFKGSAGNVLVDFSGAPAWETAALENPTGAAQDQALLWQAMDNRIALLSDGRIPPSQRLSVFGYVSNAGQPVLAGIANAPFLGMDRIKKCTWDGENLTLSGEIAGLTSAKASAVIYVPSQFAPVSAKLGGKDARPEIEGQWLILPMGSGSTFEVSFAKR